jgi:hypothetical protein
LRRQFDRGHHCRLLKLGGKLPVTIVPRETVQVSQNVNNPIILHAQTPQEWLTEG